jgi:hypothetical protein
MDILFSRKNRSFYFFFFLILSVLRERWFSKCFPVFTACPNKSGSKLKRFFLFWQRKIKCDHLRPSHTGGGGSIRGWRKQPGENFFYCLCFLCLFHWLPWMRKLLLCRYIHTRVDIDCAGRRAKPIAHSNIYGRTTRVTQSSKNCGECSTPWLWKLYTYTHTHAQVVVAVVG